MTPVASVNVAPVVAAALPGIVPSTVHGEHQQHCSDYQEQEDEGARAHVCLLRASGSGEFREPEIDYPDRCERALKTVCVSGERAPSCILASSALLARTSAVAT